MPNAVIYCRVSSVGQQDNYSLETQETACREFAAALGYTIEGVTAEVWTGAEFWERPKLSKLREDVRARRVDAVVCYAIDRLSRDIAHLAIFAEECERAGVALHFVTESFDDSAEGKLIRSVRGYTAEVERQKIKERMTRGMKARVAAGKRPNGSTGLYGYTQDRETTARQLDPEESAIVKRIWHEAYTLGYGATAIAKRLNAEGIPSPAAKKRDWKDGRAPRWAKSVILQILKNPSYAGLTYAFRYGKKRVNGKEIHYERPRSEWIILADSLTPPIITEEMFDGMAARLRSRFRQADATRNLNKPTLLRGLIWCGRCGKRRAIDYSHAAYRCTSRYSIDGSCGSKATPQKPIEDCVWSEVEKLIRQPERISQLIAAATDAEADDKDALKKQIAEAEAKIKANRRKQEALLSRFADADDALSVLIENQIRALAESSRSLTADLETAREWLANDGQRHQRAADLSAAFESFSADDSLSFDAKRALLECLELRVETDGRERWRVLFGVTFPEMKSGSSALNFQLFSAERPLFKDGRWFRFNPAS